MNKCFLSTAANQHITMKDYVTLKIQLCHHRNKLHFKIYSSRKYDFILKIK